MNAGRFFDDAMSALRRTGARGVFLGGWPGNIAPVRSADVMSCTYAPMSKLLPRATVVVHAGGYGSTTQALRSGVPQLVIPWGFDQLFHARAVTTLGVGHEMPRRRLSEEKLRRMLEALLTDASVRAAAESVGEELRSEPDGAERASEEIESFLRAVS
jgi:UDP:flavonoid glycosyltransferase YjiC (YdhE family)